jgi:hypothetical protein
MRTLFDIRAARDSARNVSAVNTPAPAPAPATAQLTPVNPGSTNQRQ